MLLVAASVALIASTCITGAASQESYDQIATSCTSGLERAFDLSKGDTGVANLVRSARDGGYIKCSSYLPWSESFFYGGTGYIDGIHPQDMEKSVMWGMDPHKRIFVAVKSICDGAREGVVAFFQRYNDQGVVVSGGHFQSMNGMCNLAAGTERGVEYLQTLLTKGTVTIQNSIGSSNFKIS